MSYYWEIHYSIVATEERYPGRAWLSGRRFWKAANKTDWFSWKLHYLFMLKSVKKLVLENLIKCFHISFISFYILLTSFNQDECTLSYHRKGLHFYMFKIEFLKRYSISRTSFRMWYRIRAEWYNEFSIVMTVIFIDLSSNPYWLWTYYIATKVAEAKLSLWLPFGNPQFVYFEISWCW